MGTFFANLEELAGLCRQVYFEILFIPNEAEKKDFDAERALIRNRLLVFFGGFGQTIDSWPPS
jgi:hypothetical protein